MKKIFIVFIALFVFLCGATYEKEHNLRQTAVLPLEVINGATKAYKAICAIFEKKKITTYKDINTKRGFNNFLSTTFHDYLEEFEPDSFDELVDIYARSLQMTSKGKKLFKSVVDDITMSESNSWMQYHIVFDQESLKNKQMSFMSVFSKEEQNHTYSILIVYMKTSFQLSDNLRLASDRTKVGIFKDNTKQHIEAKPRGMTNEDVQDLFWFFQLVSFRHVAQTIGNVQLEEPQLDEQ